MAIQYFDALAGAGKTRSLARYAIQLAKAGEHVLFIQPSKQLIDATLRDEFSEEQGGLSISAIHGGNTRNVVQSIIQFTKDCSRTTGAVLFITHEAFMRLLYIENRHDWHLIFDEVPTVDSSEAYNIAETHRVITDSLSICPYDAAYGIIIAKEDAIVPLRTIARNRRSDDIWAKFRGLASQILSPHWDVFALHSNYNSLINSDRAITQLVIHALLKPSIFEGFKQVILASALFTESTLYKLWSMQGTEFIPVADQMLDNLRYRDHGNGNLITIRYLIDRDWSKTLRDKPICFDGESNAHSLRERIPGLIKSALCGEAFAWIGNTDIADNYFGVPEAVRLPNSPHGLNSYQQLHHVVALSALNATPAHFRFMETRGISGNDLQTASYRSAIYQATMRISIRDPANTMPKSITVMDATTAHWLSDLFPGSHLEPSSELRNCLPNSRIGRPRRYASDNDRVRAHRIKKRSKQWLNTFCSGNEGSSPSFGTAYASIYDTTPLMHLDAASLDAFIALLKEAHSRVIRSKHDNFLISPAHFDPDGNNCDTRRGLANVRHVNGLWLDNDGGDLSPDEFARLFPQLRMVIWNTYSSTVENPRWRCFIPTSDPLSVDDYTGLTRQIFLILRHHNFADRIDADDQSSSKKRHGFDIGKLNAAALFFAPCLANNPDHSFFIEYNDNNRYPLNVDQWLAHGITAYAAPLEILEAETQNQSDNIASSSLQNIDQSVKSEIDYWRNTPPRQGHRAFFRLACSIRRSGMNRDNARKLLLDETQFAKSPRERRTDLDKLLPRLWGST